MFLPRYVSFVIRLWWWELSYYEVLSRPNQVSLSVLPQVLSLLLPPLALGVTLSKGLHRLFAANKHGIHCEPWPTMRASLFHMLQVRYVSGFQMVQWTSELTSPSCWISACASMELPSEILYLQDKIQVVFFEYLHTSSVYPEPPSFDP